MEPDGSAQSRLQERCFDLEDLPLVGPSERGEGLPYAPQDWPNPGDKWGWTVTGKRKSINGGYWQDRTLVPPERLRIPGAPHCLKSKSMVKKYITEHWVDVNTEEFFASFHWHIPCTPASEEDDVDTDAVYALNHARDSDAEADEGMANDKIWKACTAGKYNCPLKTRERRFPQPAECNICCVERNFCRECSCILCCKPVDQGSSIAIYCEQKVNADYICGHVAHLTCAVNCQLAGVVKRNDLNVEYYCRRCDKRTCLKKNVLNLISAAELYENKSDIESILEFISKLVQGTEKSWAKSIEIFIENAIQQLQFGKSVQEIFGDKYYMEALNQTGAPVLVQPKVPALPKFDSVRESTVTETISGRAKEKIQLKWGEVDLAREWLANKAPANVQQRITDAGLFDLFMLPGPSMSPAEVLNVIDSFDDGVTKFITHVHGIPIVLNVDESTFTELFGIPSSGVKVAVRAGKDEGHREEMEAWLNLPLGATLTFSKCEVEEANETYSLFRSRIFPMLLSQKKIIGVQQAWIMKKVLIDGTRFDWAAFLVAGLRGEVQKLRKNLESIYHVHFTFFYACLRKFAELLVIRQDGQWVARDTSQLSKPWAKHIIDVMHTQDPLVEDVRESLFVTTKNISGVCGCSLDSTRIEHRVTHGNVKRAKKVRTKADDVAREKMKRPRVEENIVVPSQQTFKKLLMNVNKLKQAVGERRQELVAQAPTNEEQRRKEEERTSMKTLDVLDSILGDLPSKSNPSKDMSHDLPGCEPPSKTSASTFRSKPWVDAPEKMEFMKGMMNDMVERLQQIDPNIVRWNPSQDFEFDEVPELPPYVESVSRRLYEGVTAYVASGAKTFWEYQRWNELLREQVIALEKQNKELTDKVKSLKDHKELIDACVANRDSLHMKEMEWSRYWSTIQGKVSLAKSNVEKDMQMELLVRKAKDWQDYCAWVLKWGKKQKTHKQLYKVEKEIYMKSWQEEALVRQKYELFVKEIGAEGIFSMFAENIVVPSQQTSKKLLMNVNKLKQAIGERQQELVAQAPTKEEQCRKEEERTFMKNVLDSILGDLPSKSNPPKDMFDDLPGCEPPSKTSASTFRSKPWVDAPEKMEFMKGMMNDMVERLQQIAPNIVRWNPSQDFEFEEFPELPPDVESVPRRLYEGATTYASSCAKTFGESQRWNEFLREWVIALEKQNKELTNKVKSLKDHKELIDACVANRDSLHMKEMWSRYWSTIQGKVSLAKSNVEKDMQMELLVRKAKDWQDYCAWVLKWGKKQNTHKRLYKVEKAIYMKSWHEEALARRKYELFVKGIGAEDIFSMFAESMVAVDSPVPRITTTARETTTTTFSRASPKWTYIEREKILAGVDLGDMDWANTSEEQILHRLEAGLQRFALKDIALDSPKASTDSSDNVGDDVDDDPPPPPMA